MALAPSFIEHYNSSSSHDKFFEQTEADIIVPEGKLYPALSAHLQKVVNPDIAIIAGKYPPASKYLPPIESPRYKPDYSTDGSNSDF